MQRRYSSVYRKAYEMLKEGAIGPAKFMNHVEYRGDWAKKSKDPEEDRRIGEFAVGNERAEKWSRRLDCQSRGDGA